MYGIMIDAHHLWWWPVDILQDVIVAFDLITNQLKIINEIDGTVWNLCLPI